ncbi:MULTISPECIES: universal stress protein [Actinomadura]|uniref:universal stress protein n=1 Tax=Actinomadura TaxID=1988 RepID=UPI00041DD681|nr:MULTISPECIES: universal stress protein [Actinomadura]RSN72069.1 universal stress protein [Actinomadura sp. WAC 06369]
METSAGDGGGGLLPIVVGVDGSRPSDRAVEWAADRAVRMGRVLRLVYVSEVWPYEIPFHAAPDDSESITWTDNQVLAEGERVALAWRPDVELECRLAVGGTVRVLSEGSQHASELVVGHRGLGGFAGLLLGSVSVGVVAYAQSPVVVVRGETGGRRGELAVGASLEGDASALAYAFEEAVSRGLRVRVVHAVPLPKGTDEEHLASDLERSEERARSRIAEECADLRHRYPEADVIEDIVQDRPAAALVAASREADLVVAGVERAQPEARLPRRHAVRHALVHHAECPVALVRPRG